MHPSSYNKDNSCPNFWQMIWETKSKLIVMLRKLEIDFSGCSEYFPKRRDQIVQHGDFVIKNVSKVDKNVFKKSQKSMCYCRSFEVSKIRTNGG